MSSEVKRDVEEIIRKAKAFYKENPERLRADYRAEKEFNKDYNGRQLLELIQNCDDEKADEIFFSLNTRQNSFSISNTGTAFSLKGYESLTVAHLSPKLSKRQFIGNKGLGFRSLINWSTVINVYSNGFCVQFSESLKKDIFQELYSPDERQTILEELDLKDHVVPVPMLAIPVLIDEFPETGYTTTIEVNYHEKFETDILSQINDLGADTLIFLNHVSRIKIQVDGEETFYECNRKALGRNSDDLLGPVERVAIGSEEWNIYKTEASLPDNEESESREPDYYEIKLAIKDDLSDENTYLYSYLRTQIRVNFPFLVHATFDLTLNRNGFAESEKNKLVIQETVRFIIKTALELTHEQVSWLPLRMLIGGLNNQNTVLEKLGFNEEIQHTINSEPIFPCVDGQYRTKSEVTYWSPEFSSLIQKHGWQDVLPNVVISPYDTIELSSLYLEKKISGIQEVALKLSQRISDIEVRADLISEILKFNESDFSCLFIDENFKRLSPDIIIYTPVRQNLSIPKHCSFKTINRKLFKALRNKLNLEEDENSDQALRKKLSKIVSIELFDKENVAREIIRQTNKSLDSDTIDAISSQSMVLEQIECLYEMDGLPSMKDEQVHLINQLGEVKKAENLFLSEAYVAPS